jgi:hypothetical protein
MDVLRSNGRKPGQGFYLDRVILFDGYQISTREPTGPSSAPSVPGFGGPRGRGFAPPPGGAPPGVVSAVDSRGRDPVTNEPMDQDWRFVLWVDAIPQDFPEPEPVEPEAESDGD